MKKNILVATCLATVALMAGSQAIAASKKNFYVAVPFGYSFVSKPKSNDGSFAVAKLKNSFLVGVAAGYDFGGMRTEVSFGYRNNMRFTINDVVTKNNGNYANYSSMSVKAYSFMVDLYKDFDIGSDFTPYVGVGLGVTRFKTGDYSYTNYSKANVLLQTTSSVGRSSNSFSWRVGLGMNYKLTESVDVGLGYAYNYLGKITRNDPLGLRKNTGAVDKVKFRSNEIVANIKFKF